MVSDLRDHVKITCYHYNYYNRKLSGNDTFCCYVDFKKAFDSVNRECLWDKLARYGINGPFLSTLQSLYEEYQCCVEVNGNCTPWFEVYK